MSRDKQTEIEEMAKALTKYEYHLCERLPKDKCLLTSAVHAQVSCDYCKIAEFLVNEGYRKASNVAREIFEEIEQYFIVKKLGLLNATYTKDFFHELKKKYESEGAE